MRNRSWRNWAGNRSSRCEVVDATCRQDLVDAVRRARAEDKPLRPAGGSYSWSELVPCPGLIVRTQRMKRILHVDRERCRVTVEAGMSVGALTRALAGHGLALVSPTLFPRPTVGGAISTGSHGTGFDSGNFADQVVEIELVDGRGNPVTVAERDLPAARVALGALGPIYSVTLQAVPQYSVRTEIRRVPLLRVLEEFDDLLASHQFLEIFWFPFQREMWLYLMDRADAPPDRRTWRQALQSDAFTAVQEASAGRLIPWVARFMPRLTPVLNAAASRVAFCEGVSIQTASDAFHFQKAYPKNWDLSYAFPTDQARQAWADAIQLVDQYAKARLYPVNLAVHGRFTGPGSAWLAPDYGRPTAYVEITTARGTPHYEDFFRELERRWCGLDGARPHWGKLYWAYARLAGLYPRMDDFQRVRARFDPHGVFLNPFLEKWVFRSGAPAAAEPRLPVHHPPPDPLTPGAAGGPPPPA